MNMRVNGRKYISSPEADALAAAALFIVFNIECERFDQTVCTGLPAEDGSGTMPRDATETGIIARHAARLGLELLERAQSFGLPIDVLRAGEAFVKRMPYAKVKADYQQALVIIGGSLDR